MPLTCKSLETVLLISRKTITIIPYIYINTIDHSKPQTINEVKVVQIAYLLVLIEIGTGLM